MLNTNINRRPISRWRRLVAVVVLIAAALPVAAVATNTAGAPSGVLRDPSGRVLPGATVRLSAINSEAVHETQSDAGGAFQFGEIPDGDYMFSARLPGFLSARQRVRVTSSMAPLDLALQVGTLKETVTVRSDDGTPVGEFEIETQRRQRGNRLRCDARWRGERQRSQRRSARSSPLAST